MGSPASRVTANQRHTESLWSSPSTRPDRLRANNPIGFTRRGHGDPVLEPEPKTRQSCQFNGWNGTPAQLVDVAVKTRSLLPDAAFTAVVRTSDDRDTVASEPRSQGDSLKCQDQLRLS